MRWWSRPGRADHILRYASRQSLADVLGWREIDIWRHIEREGIPIVDLYFARNGRRYRSLGDQDITNPGRGQRCSA